VYVIGLSPRVADELKLCTDSYFGQYGEIKKFVVNKNNAYFDSVHGPSYSAYITFATETQASTCIHATNNHSLDGRRIKATFGTTKY
jgi:CCR4-NOT transcription complex subunit 4